MTVWGCFSSDGVGPIHHIPGTMDQCEYIRMLQEVRLRNAEEEMALKWVFQLDTDPKHTNKVLVLDKQN